ncbi:hypothetical protein SUGI_0195520 [Cryptomeria japonica]|nr:hypothetical protein SUGI_0195520 [Cryptomeria japonica]
MAVPASVNRAAALEINKAGPYIGLIMADQTEEQTLLAAGVFLPCAINPWLDFSGRRFNIGSINGQKIIYVRCGQRRLNAGVTTQMLIDLFDIAGVVHYGTAGNANNSLSIGDVSVPKYIAYTGSWKWTKFGTKMVGDQLGYLHFGNYDVPVGNKTNLLSNIVFQPEEFFSENSEMQEIFWLEATRKWFYTASKLEGLKLEGCVNSTFCLPEPPKVVVGLNASSADIFVDNAAFRGFLFNHFQVASVDEESAAIAMICQSSNLPVIVFRGLSDLAGGDKENVSSMFSSLAAKNALTAAIAFLSLLQHATEGGGVPNALQLVDT